MHGWVCVCVYVCVCVNVNVDVDVDVNVDVARKNEQVQKYTSHNKVVCYDENKGSYTERGI